MTRWLKYQRLLFTSLQCVNKLAKYIKFKHFFSKYSTKILLLLNYIFFSGKLKISNFQRTHALILLVKDLNARVPENIPKKVADIITSMQLPSLENLPIPLLQKKKPEKESILVDSWGLATEENIRTGLASLKTDVLIPAFKIAIESNYFSSTFWKSRLRKVAGIFIIR